MAPVLAQSSQPIGPLAPTLDREPSTWEQTTNEELESGLDLPQPHFSIAMDDEADGDDVPGEVPPRLSMPLEGEEQTGRSIEVGRYAASENRKGRVSTGSFGSMGLCDRVSNVTEADSDDISRAPLDDKIVDCPLDGDPDEVKYLGLRLDVE